MYNQTPIRPKIEQSDLQSFRTYSLVFLFSTFGAIIGNLALAGLGSLIEIIGYLSLTYGIYMLSKKYPNLQSGMKVAYLFVVIILLDIVSAIVTLTYPEPTYSLTNGSSAQSIIQAYLPILLIGLGFSIVISFVLLFASYYFTHWFNEEITPFNTTQAFWYFGLLNFIGVIIAGFGSYTLFTFLANNSINLSSGTVPSGLLTASLITLVGGVFALAGAITLIVSSFKIYYRVNDIVSGKAFFKGPNQPQGYGQPPYGQQPPYSQQSFSQPAGQPSSQQTSTQYSGQAETVFCRNCGTQLEKGATFCGNCGTKV